jgi:hypothetical protein
LEVHNDSARQQAVTQARVIKPSEPANNTNELSTPHAFRCTNNPTKHQVPVMAPALRDIVAQRVREAIYTAFSEAYQKAYAYYDDDKLDECITEFTEILNDGRVPRYIKISTLVLLALVVKSEDDFRAARTEAGTSSSASFRIPLTLRRDALPNDDLFPPQGRG